MTTRSEKTIATPSTSVSASLKQSRARDYVGWLIGATLFALALALRLYRLGAQSLWLDEGSTWAEVTRRSWGALLADLWSPTAAYPLYHLLLKGWVGLAGDVEWALRLPSALAGALTAAVMYVVALQEAEVRGQGAGVGLRSSVFGLPSIPSTSLRAGVHRPSSTFAALLFAMSPFALWHAQDAKVYSLVMLMAALLLWALLRALRHPRRSAWLLVAALAVVGLLMHRLLLLPLAGLSLAAALVLPHTRARLLAGALALGCGAAGIYGLARAVATNGWQESGHSAAGPLLGLWLTLVHFSLDRADIGGFLGLPLAAWLLPSAALTLWGMWRLARDAWRGHMGAVVVLCALVVPLALFALALAFAPIYEARYATVAFPAWVLVLAWPFRGQATGDRRQATGDRRQATGDRRQATRRPAEESPTIGYRLSAIGYAPSLVHRLSSSIIVFCLLLVNAAVLLQPKHGLFSGAPVKEEWRAAISYLAGELHPNDLLVLHPYYTRPLWEYYAPRVTPDPLPQPTTFGNFAEGDCIENNAGDPSAIRTCYQRRYERPFNEAAYGKQRALLLIAPEHAATIDRPKTVAELRAEGVPADVDDSYGWIGLRFQFSEAQRTWPCGGVTFVGVQVMCQSFPETFNAGGPGRIPAPDVPLQALFGGEIKLLGYSIEPLGGALRPGGSLPITLFWQAVAPPTHNYSMFLHLCRDCTVPPLAGTDLPPLKGYPPAGLTTTWQVGDPVHDERALVLPADLPPGRYTLLLGVRPADDPNLVDSRLPVTSADARVLGDTRVVLGEVEVKR